ncbi:uncharacterized protein LOC144713773 [Wolffia australiana]
MPRRSLWKGSFVDAFLSKMVEKGKSMANRKIWSRRSSILPEFVGSTVLIYNGRVHVRRKISEGMVGHKFGEFAMTRKRKRWRGAAAPPPPKRGGARRYSTSSSFCPDLASSIPLNRGPRFSAGISSRNSFFSGFRLLSTTAAACIASAQNERLKYQWVQNLLGKYSKSPSTMSVSLQEGIKK